MNNRGKSICKELKRVRRAIAEENGIPLEIKECNFKGECRGTCPRCEAEVRYLENAIADRLRIGKVATVAGLALSLSVTANQVQAQTLVDTLPNQPDKNIQQMGCIKGKVTDLKTHDPLPFVSVVIYKDSVQYAAAVTDFDGVFKVHVPPGRLYDLRMMFPGYLTYVRQGIAVKESGFTVVDIEATSVGMGDSAAVQGLPSVIQVGGIESGRKHTEEDIENMPSPSLDSQLNDPNPAYFPHEHMNIEGVKVHVR